MKENLKTVGLIAIFVVLGLVMYYSTGTTIEPEVVSEPIVGCYVATIDKDVYTLDIMSQTEENVKGMLSFDNYQKDSSSGTFTGTYKDDILFGQYAFRSEGMDSIIDVVFKKEGSDFIRGFGPLDQETGSRFTNLKKITYDANLNYAVFKSGECTNSLGVSTENGVIFQYPETITTTYVTASKWPPKAEVKDAPMECVSAEDEISLGGTTEKRNILGREYCVEVLVEGSTGSTYREYIYSTEMGNKVVSLDFTLQFPQCLNYPKSKQEACTLAQNTFSVDTLVARIIHTVQ